MVKFNLITEGFIKNTLPSGIRIVNPEEIDSLLDVTTSGSFSISGSDILDLSVDLGFQHSIDLIRYKTTPLSTSGLIIEYGRTSNNLVTGVIQTVGQEVQVSPTISGFTYPRFFRLRHSPGVSVDVDFFTIENTEEEVRYGLNGNTTNLTITSPLTGGTSDIVEIPVLNSGSLTSDIFVTVDVSKTSSETFNNLEIAPTASGEFISVDPNTVPDVIPWEWGHFNNTFVDEDNNLSVTNPSILSLGAVWVGSFTGFNYRTRGDGDIKWVNNTLVYVRAGDSSGFRLMFVDPLLRVIHFSPTAVPYSISSNNTNKEGLHLAYDGDDLIYWIRGHSSSGGARELYRYSVSSGVISLVNTLTDYHTYFGKGIVYKDGFLYLLGGSSTPQVDTTSGLLVTRYQISTGTTTSLSPLPVSPTEKAVFKLLGGFIYYFRGIGSEMYRYNISSDSWASLPPKISTTNTDGMTVDRRNNKVVVSYGNRGDCTGTNNSPLLEEFDPISEAWQVKQTPPCADFGNFTDLFDEIEYIANSSSFFYKTRGSFAGRFASYVDKEPSVTSSGSYLSPVFLVRQGITTSGTGENLTVISGLDSFHRALINRVETESIRMTSDPNLLIENFEIRSSNSSPSGDNTAENFTSAQIDTERHVVGSTGGVFASQGELGLEFNHAGSSSVSSSFLYLNQSFASSGKMQYRIWWNPPEVKAAGNQNNRTSIYIVPFLDTINTGLTPGRDETTLIRNETDHIRIFLGSETNTTNFTEIEVFRGGTTSNDTFPINASSGIYYDIIFNIDWGTGDYSLRFGGKLIGTGNIPLSTRLVLDPSHTVEIFSCSTGTGVSFTEYFRYLTVNRINLSARQDFSATPLHLDDPLFGVNGSLPFYPLTVNSPLLPVQDYLQIKLSYISTNSINKGLASRISFPPVIRLPEVPVGGTKSVYLRYNFPPSNNLVEDRIFLKSYVATNKED